MSIVLRGMAALFGLALVGVAALPAVAADSGGATQALAIAGSGGVHEFQVEIADDPAERGKGLMFRREMANDHGMLFDFQSEQPVGFWMRNTYIPLDMLFVTADGTINSVAEKTTPLSERSIRSKVPVRYVLEINGGLSRMLGIKPGDKLSGPALSHSQ